MSTFRNVKMEHVRTGIIENLQWLINNYGFKITKSKIIPEISKGEIIAKSGYGPGEY
ncbi:hypothetical protein GCM10009117_08870 [Gangjinia marincola]|uniref:Uncharacterized protein n=1 Tax=Gangjinia marincola TaxID=578463 RepID=A0ABN1MF57_9FLAO